MPDREAKEQLLTLIQEAVAETHGPDARLYCYGSSVNGCGEAQSDVDTVAFVSASPDDDAERLPSSSEALRLVAAMIDQHPRLRVAEQRLQANFPILTIELLDEGGQRSTGYVSDLSFGHMLPQYNSRLLRTYAELAPALPVLSVLMKRWAKATGIAKTWEGFVSSYSWTLMMVYYLQIRHGLPSLHVMASRRADYQKRRLGNFDARFVSDKEEALRLAALACEEEAEPGAAPSFRSASLGELLAGFFEFYSDKFEWESEVVSVRLGERRQRGARGFNPRLCEAEMFFRGRWRRQTLPRFLNIEDPIEVHRNLNFALKPDTGPHIREAVRDAHFLLTSKRGQPGLLQELLSEPSTEMGTVRAPAEPILPQDDLLGRWLEGCLSTPPLEAEGDNALPSRCSRCGMFFDNFMERHEHEFRRECKLQPPEFQCPVCFKGFTTEEGWLAHSEATGHAGEPMRLARPPLGKARGKPRGRPRGKPAGKAPAKPRSKPAPVRLGSEGLAH